MDDTEGSGMRTATQLDRCPVFVPYEFVVLETLRRVYRR
jgi:hypothetical protein